MYLCAFPFYFNKTNKFPKYKVIENFDNEIIRILCKLIYFKTATFRNFDI